MESITVRKTVDGIDLASRESAEPDISTAHSRPRVSQEYAAAADDGDDALVDHDIAAASAPILKIVDELIRSRCEECEEAIQGGHAAMLQQLLSELREELADLRDSQPPGFMRSYIDSRIGEVDTLLSGLAAAQSPDKLKTISLSTLRIATARPVRPVPVPAAPVARLASAEPKAKVTDAMRLRMMKAAVARMFDEADSVPAKREDRIKYLRRVIDEVDTAKAAIKDPAVSREARQVRARLQALLAGAGKSKQPWPTQLATTLGSKDTYEWSAEQDIGDGAAVTLASPLQSPPKDSPASTASAVISPPLEGKQEIEHASADPDEPAKQARQAEAHIPARIPTAKEFGAFDRKDSVESGAQLATATPHVAHRKLYEENMCFALEELNRHATKPQSAEAQAKLQEVLKVFRQASLQACAEGQWDLADRYADLIQRLSNTLVWHAAPEHERSGSSPFAAVLGAIKSRVGLENLSQPVPSGEPGSSSGDLARAHSQVLRALDALDALDSKASTPEQISTAHIALANLELATEVFAAANARHGTAAWTALHHAYQLYKRACIPVYTEMAKSGRQSEAQALRAQVNRHEAVAKDALGRAQSHAVGQLRARDAGASLRAKDTVSSEFDSLQARVALEEVARGNVSGHLPTALHKLQTLLESRRIELLAASARGDLQAATVARRQMQALRGSVLELQKFAVIDPRGQRMSAAAAFIRRLFNPGEVREAAQRAIRSTQVAIEGMRVAPAVGSLHERILPLRTQSAMDALGALKNLRPAATAQEKAEAAETARSELVRLQSATRSFVDQSGESHFERAELALEGLHSAFMLYLQYCREARLGGSAQVHAHGLEYARMARATARERVDGPMKAHPKGLARDLTTGLPPGVEQLARQGYEWAASREARQRGVGDQWTLMTTASVLLREMSLGNAWQGDFRLQIPGLVGTANLSPALRARFGQILATEEIPAEEAASALNAAIGETWAQIEPAQLQTFAVARRAADSPAGR